MSKWLDTRGNTTLSIAICDRSKMKRAYDFLVADINFPGLRVCQDTCADQKDPYRLPARQTEKISLRFPRPDVDIGVVGDAITTDPNVGNNITPEMVPSPTPGEFGIAPETSENPIDGNLDNLSP